MNSRTLWVFCSGLKRSGSTLQYQVAKSLVEESGRGVGLGFAGENNWFDLLRENRDRGGIVVVKCHRYLPGAASLLRSGSARSIFIHRDFRDVCVSWMKMGRRSFDQVMEESFFQELMEDDFHWSRLPNTMVSAYDQVMADLESEVLRIASFLAIPVSPDHAARLAERLSLRRAQRHLASFDFAREGVRLGKKSVYDPSTLLHHNHVRSGASRQWETELTDQQVRRLERATGDWLPAHGYDPAGDGSDEPALSSRDRLRLRLQRARADAAVRLRLRLDSLPGRAGRGLLPGPIRSLGGRILRGLVSPAAARLLGGALYRLLGGTSVAAPELGKSARILVARLDRIGDAVLTVPFLRELRRSAPRAEITLVVRPEVRELLEDSPYVDRVLTFDPDTSSRLPELVRRWRLLRLAARHLWGQRPDIAVIPRWDTDLYDATFLLYFSGARHRVAYTERSSEEKSQRNHGYDRLLTWAVEGTGAGHEVERNLELLKRLGGEVVEHALELSLGEADHAFAQRIWEEHQLGGRGPVIAMGVGASQGRKIWPTVRFADLATRLEQARGARILLLGSLSERGLGGEVKQQAGERVIDLMGATTLRQSAALLQRCDLYVGNDTGVLHMAAAVGTPVVGIWCSSSRTPDGHTQSPARFGPWGVPAEVVRPARSREPCDGTCTVARAHCICEVGVEEVERAVCGVLARSAVSMPRANASGV